MKPAPSCIPEVPRFSGTLLVLGSALRMADDLRHARSLRPGAHILGINEAGGGEEDMEHLLAGHTEKAQLFYDYRRKKFPHSPPVLVHAKTWADEKPYDPCITHLWRNVACGATSAWVAVRIGKAMGYDEIILCGCPIDDSGYYNEPETGRFKHACKRLGYGETRGENGMYHNYRASFQRHALREGKGQNVYSMSGFSMSLLGLPPKREKVAC